MSVGSKSNYEAKVCLLQFIAYLGIPFGALFDVRWAEIALYHLQCEREPLVHSVAEIFAQLAGPAHENMHRILPIGSSWPLPDYVGGLNHAHQRRMGG
jgi:hypothetical protein